MSPPFKLFQQPPIHSELRSGRSIPLGSWTITPVSHSLRLLVPFPRGGLGFIWNRPVAVTVQAGNGPTYRLPVVDRTRRIQALIWLAALGVILLAAMWQHTGGTHDVRN